MEFVSTVGSATTNKTCKVPPLSSYAVKYPTFTTLSVKNFKNAVDFHPREKAPCKNTWYQDLKSTHIRNKHLLDLPFLRPQCCSDVYNKSVYRRKLKKLRNLGITLPEECQRVWPLTTLEPEIVERCIPGPDTEDANVVHFPECYIPSESSDEDEDEDEESYDLCMSDSISECSGCSTLGGGTRRRIHKLIKRNWRDLLHKSAQQLCQESVAEEFRKHKLGRDFELKLDKRF